jgi:LacI family transcriptional regulator
MLDKSPLSSEDQQMASPQRASVKDVAQLAGVSVGTVSNVLNRPEAVSERTRNKVLVAMSELNFLRNASARNLRAGSSTTVGVIVQDVRNPFYTELIRGIEDRLELASLALISCSSDADPDREAIMLDLLCEQGVRGILITPTDATDERVDSLAALGISTVIMDAQSRATTSVWVDNLQGGRLAVAHLLSMGHRRIAMLAAKQTHQTTRQRCAGATEAVVDAGLDPAEVLEIRHLEFTDVRAGREAMTALLAKPNPPTAVFAINDLLAIGVLRELRECDLRVPQDVAVVGYDDISLAADLMVPLTSVRQPTRQLGWAAADLLLTGNPHPAFIPELIVRESSDFRRR